MKKLLHNRHFITWCKNKHFCSSFVQKSGVFLRCKIRGITAHTPNTFSTLLSANPPKKSQNHPLPSFVLQFRQFFPQFFSQKAFSRFQLRPTFAAIFLRNNKKDTAAISWICLQMIARYPLCGTPNEITARA